MSYPATDNHHGQLESLTPAARHWLDGGQAWWALPEVARSKWPALGRAAGASGT